MEKNWLWKSLFLGFVFFVAMLIQRPVGISTQFSIATGVIEKVANPEIVYKSKKIKVVMAVLTLIAIQVVEP